MTVRLVEAGFCANVSVARRKTVAPSFMGALFRIRVARPVRSLAHSQPGAPASNTSHARQAAIGCDTPSSRSRSDPNYRVADDTGAIGKHCSVHAGSIHAP